MKPFTRATAIILAVVGIAHALRLGLGWSINANGLDVPMWVSIVGMLVAAGLAIGLWREAGVPAAAGGISQDQLVGLLNLNERIHMKQALLAQAFPPGLANEQALERFEAFAKEKNYDTSLDPRKGTAELRRRQ
jgi:hypothetical protein